MLMQTATEPGIGEGSVFKGIFYFLLARLGVRRLRGHSFFGTLLAQPVVIADFGAHQGEFFAALKAEYSVSRALLIEADPELAESLKRRFGEEANVLHAALVGGNKKERIMFTRSVNPESSSIFSERAAAYGVVNQVEVPTVELSQALRQLGGRVDLAKFDVEGAELDALKSASGSDLGSCSQLTVEFHENRRSITRRDIARSCQHMRFIGYGIVNASWPYVDDVLFVNLRRIAAGRRLRFLCRMALVNALFVLRGAFFWSVRLLKRIRWNQSSLP
jgi:FkbM family methyltransferase